MSFDDHLKNHLQNRLQKLVEEFNETIERYANLQETPSAVVEAYMRDIAEEIDELERCLQKVLKRMAA